MLQERIFNSKPPPGGRGFRPFTAGGFCRLAGALLVLVLTSGGDARAAEGKSALEVLRPTDLRVTAGTFFPGFLIYESPGPMAGVEVGWRTGTNTSLVANLGGGATWITGSTRVFAPVGLTLRVHPWQRGPLWIQAGIGSMPYLETVSLTLPERTASATYLGATLTTKLALGVRVAGWEFGVGSDANLLPSPFYTTYTGDESVPWNNTFIVWIGRQLWTREQQ